MLFRSEKIILISAPVVKNIVIIVGGIVVCFIAVIYLVSDFGDGSDISSAFITYARPLIQGDVTVPTKDGLPVFAYRK